jgi:hypothetical protein
LTVPFTPTPDVAVILNQLLDIYERRGGQPRQKVRANITEIADDLPGYFSQTDPAPRVTANEQLTHLAELDLLRLLWQQGQDGHLLESVTLKSNQPELLYVIIQREPVAEQRQRLRHLLLGDRFRLDGWRLQAIDHCLSQLRSQKSAAPFSLTDEDWNRDLLAALIALPGADTTEEIPYRVFSVRVFNDSKRFETLKESVARLARRHNPMWHDLTSPEVLRELGLVANPGHLYLYGPWQLVDSDGQVMSLTEFYPSVGIPTTLAARVQSVRVDTARVVCVENLASFYELIRHQGHGIAALCLWGNPSPVTRHLLRALVQSLPPSIPLQVWADIDYGGLNILAQLRQQVSLRFEAYHMDSNTLTVHARWAHPLSGTDERNLKRLRNVPVLADMVPLIDEMLQRSIKLEQEAVVLNTKSEIDKRRSPH